ncbi:hypothetical protein COU37_00765 [Candidatus Micrarchaeota archaeon CG10_big_fil_rev_8_21_14_0_10_45_29]|nr:MAG: hypothetical protein COU37_00765 [Candidatus Micrarchaeota archaeon CG10_big_fil_rev_8_21_14_0_10_45_29]
MVAGKKENNYSYMAGACTIVLIAAAIALPVIVNYFFPFKGMPMSLEFEIYEYLRAGMTLLILGFSTFLIFTYLRDYFELKCKFTLGLLLALISFMLFAITSNPILHTAMGFNGPISGILSILPLFFATLALAILAWVSSK